MTQKDRIRPDPGPQHSFVVQHNVGFAQLDAQKKSFICNICTLHCTSNNQQYITNQTLLLARSPFENTFQDIIFTKSCGKYAILVDTICRVIVLKYL